MRLNNERQNPASHLEGFGILDTGGMAFDGTLLDRSRGSSICDMEEYPMQSAQGISLLFALLETQPQRGPAQTAAMPSQSNAVKYRNELDPGDQEKVLEGLYKAIGFIIGEYQLPYSRSLTKGVGKALSMGIREEMRKTNPDEDIQRLVDFLRPVVIEAIDNIKPY